MGESVIQSVDGLAVAARLTVETYDAVSMDLLERETQHNLTTLFGKKLLLSKLFAQGPSYVLGVAAGDNNSAPALTDVNLYSELIRLPLVSVSEATDNGTSGQMTVRAIMGSTVGNGATYREAALVTSLTALVSDTYNRVVFSDKIKTVSKLIVFQFDFELT